MTGTRLAGRRAIITGAASGIGAACADLFAQEGAIVLAVDLETAFAQARANCNAAARGVHLLAKSVADSDAPEKIIAEALSVCGGVDILMNNAGIGTNALAEQMSDDVWQRTMDINVTAQFRLCRAAIPHLKESKAGRIINVASVMAEGTDYGLAAYCASKAGVAGLTRTLALELGKFGITANYILPGAISTGMTRPLWDARPEIRDVWAKKSPLRRVGEPIDIARGALFLASDDGGFVTGHGLNVDGGLMLRV
ncbi:MAG TPA: SDR family NAD(P)-dependent oxidoreductase [Micropepsaceae bacterium]|nr:SDR family NAD(P)-dependent oxidoreductase [Micropepsaceae bacterium]